MATWKLSINGAAAVTIGSLGLSRPVITRRNLDTSELTLTAPLSNLNAAAVLAYGNSVALYRDAVVWFRGTVTAVPQVGSSPELRRTYVVSDAWWKLGRIVYQQPYVLKKADFSAFTGSLSTRVILGQDAWGRKLTVNQQIANISAYALHHASGAYVLSTLSAMPTPPLAEARDITCAEAIRRMVALVPDCVGSFDYSSNPPVFHLRRRTSLGTVSIDLDNEQVKEVGSLVAREDFKPRGVIFTFLTTEQDPADGRQYVRETRQTAGITTGEGVITATIQLAAGEEVPTGLATEYYNALNFTPWQGSITLKERECSRLVELGDRLNLLNGATAWASMGAVVQSTTEVLQAGETTIELGPPDHLAPQDFVELMSLWRKRGVPSDWSDKNNNGTEGVPEDSGEPGVDGGGVTEPGVDGLGGPAPALDGDPADGEGHVPEGDREGNGNAGRPPGGAGSGGAGAIGGSTDTIPKCVDGVEQQLTVVIAP